MSFWQKNQFIIILLALLALGIFAMTQNNLWLILITLIIVIILIVIRAKQYHDKQKGGH